MKKLVNIIIGCILIGISFNLFIIPNDLITNNIYGLSCLLFYKTSYNPAIFLLIINLSILLISIIVTNLENTKKYIIPSLLIPIIIYFTKDITSYIDISGLDMILITIVSGVLIGLGHGFIFKEGYSVGGIYLLQDIFNSAKVYRRKTFTYIFEMLLIVLTIYVVNFENALYSAIIVIIIDYMTVKSKVGISSSKTFFIITTKEKEVKDYIINELNHDLTEINIKGGYTNQKNKIIMTAVDTKEYFKLKEGLKIIDPKVFISIVDSYEVVNKNLTIGENHIIK